MKPVLALIVVAAAVLAGAFGPDNTEPGVAKCNPNRADSAVKQFAGWWRVPGGTVGGIYSTIYNYDPWVYYGADVTAWSMLFNSGARWAQVGWMERPFDLNRKTFTEFIDEYGGVHTWDFWSPEPENTFTTYTVLYGNYAPGYFTFRVGGVDLFYQPIGWVPNQGQLYGETQRRGDQVPGGSNNKEIFKNSHLWYSGAWRSFDGTAAVTDAAIASSQKISAFEDRAWDKACQS